MPETPGFRQTRRWLQSNHPAYLMVALFLLVLAQPILHELPFASLALNGLFTLVFITSALSVFRNRRLVIAVCCTAVPTLVLFWLKEFFDMGLPARALASAMLAAFLLLITGLMVWHIMKAQVATINTLCRSVSAYLLMGIAWGSFYQVIVLLDPSAIRPLTPAANWSEFTYFSFAVLTTLGFGDITPVSPYARSLAMIEAVAGPMYLAILIARLVAMYKQTPEQEA